MATKPRKSYSTDVSDGEWAFVAPCLALMRLYFPQRVHGPRKVFNALRWIVRSNAQRRMLPTDFPPCGVVYQPSRLWIEAGC